MSSENEHNNDNNAPSAADDLICPITLELPLDPVTAEDGQHYERSAIEAHIESRQGHELKSPVLHKGMGPRLFPAPRIKNLIETLVTAGVITGDLADKWKEKKEEKEDMELLLKEAENGCAVSMLDVGNRYKHGSHGFKKDKMLAYKWYEKSHTADYPNGTAALGGMLLSESGLPESKESGLLYLGIAAGKGSALAAHVLGMLHAFGKFNITVKDREAIKWLQKSLDLEDTSALEDCDSETARNVLKGLKNTNAPASP